MFPVAIEAWAVQWLGHWPLVQMVRGSIPDRPARSEINFSGLYVRRSWLNGTELVLDPTIWVHFLPVPFDCVITVGSGYVRTICLS